MSAATPAPYAAPPAARQAAGEACPLCGAELDPEQDWCLRCGSAARTRLAPSPNWKAPIAVLVAAAVISAAVLAAALVKLAGSSSSARTPAARTGVLARPAAPAITQGGPAATAPPAASAASPGTPAPAATTPSGSSAPPASSGSAGASTAAPTAPATTPGALPTLRKHPATPSAGARARGEGLAIPAK